MERNSSQEENESARESLEQDRATVKLGDDQAQSSQNRERRIEESYKDLRAAAGANLGPVRRRQEEKEKQRSTVNAEKRIPLHKETRRRF